MQGVQEDGIVGSEGALEDVPRELLPHEPRGFECQWFKQLGPARYSLGLCAETNTRGLRRLYFGHRLSENN
jgi:hypothetical protein